MWNFEIFQTPPHLDQSYRQPTPAAASKVTLNMRKSELCFKKHRNSLNRNLKID